MSTISSKTDKERINKIYYDPTLRETTSKALVHFFFTHSTTPHGYYIYPYQSVHILSDSLNKFSSSTKLSVHMHVHEHTNTHTYPEGEKDLSPMGSVFSM